MRGPVCAMKLLQRLSILPLAFAAGAVLVGCPNAEPEFSSIDGGATWDSLSESDREQLACNDVPDYYEENLSDDDTKRAGCYLGGAAAGAVDYALSGDADMATAACEAVYDECLNSDEGGEEGGDNCDSSAYADECTFTVDELKACADETIDGFKELASASCSDIDWEASPEEGEDGACSVIGEKCMP